MAEKRVKLKDAEGNILKPYNPDKQDVSNMSQTLAWSETQYPSNDAVMQALQEYVNVNDEQEIHGKKTFTNSVTVTTEGNPISLYAFDGQIDIANEYADLNISSKGGTLRIGAGDDKQGGSCELRFMDDEISVRAGKLIKDSSDPEEPRDNEYVTREWVEKNIDLSDDYVTLDTEQTITGDKEFTSSNFTVQTNGSGNITLESNKNLRNLSRVKVDGDGIELIKYERDDLNPMTEEYGAVISSEEMKIVGNTKLIKGKSQTTAEDNEYITKSFANNNYITPDTEQTITARKDFTGDVYLKGSQVWITSQDDAKEGGEIHLEVDNNHKELLGNNVQFDVYDGRVRFFIAGGSVGTINLLEMDFVNNYVLLNNPPADSNGRQAANTYWVRSFVSDFMSKSNNGMVPTSAAAGILANGDISTTKPYTCPYNGYIFFRTRGDNSYLNMTLKGMTIVSGGKFATNHTDDYGCVPVRKGDVLTLVETSGTSNSAIWFNSAV